MAQPSPLQPSANGVSSTSPDPPSDNSHLSIPSKRKRDDDGDEASAQQPETTAAFDDWAGKNSEELLKYYHQVLISLDTDKAVLTRVLPESRIDQEPQIKRQKSAELSTRSTISDKFVAKSYKTIDDVAADVALAVDEALKDVDAQEKPKEAVRMREFKRKALKFAAQEKAYPQIKAESQSESEKAFQEGSSVLSIVGFAPQERRLFSSLPTSEDVDLSDVALPAGVSIATVTRSNQQVPTRTLGELFGSHRALPPLNPPKQPKTQAKGTTIDFYHPEPTNARTNCYFNTKLSSGYYLDYSNAIPSSQTVPKQRERAESLAGKKPSMSELEISEVESLFRGAFSSFAPCKDDSAAIVPSSVAGRIWWQRSGQQLFERMLDAEFYGDKQSKESGAKSTTDEIDEAAIQDAIDHWDETAIDPSLDDILGTRSKADKDTDDILTEVSDLIETLSSYQRIRNLTLPNSQNRQSSDPVTGDMLATAAPEPSEEEVATYEMLKSQLTLIIKTLPPFAVAKLNGDQLDDLLISTKIQVRTDDYQGTMEEDEAGVQARLRAQQQQQHQHQQQQAAQSARQPPQPQRTSSAGGQFPNQYPAAAQYGTPGRTPQPQQYYRPGSQPGFQPQRNATPQQPRPPQPNQYTRPNGYAGNQYATQLAKAQTPYGHQNMPQYANQQRQQFAQAPQPQPGTPNATAYHQYQPPPQQGVAPTANYPGYTNGAPQQHPQVQLQRHMSPPDQQQRQMYSQSPNMQTQQRYATPTPQPSTPAQGARYAAGANQSGYSQSPGLTGYHTVISEAQQQRILEQAKARVAAGGQPGGYSNVALAAARASIANQQKPQTPTGQRSSTPVLPPHRVTPVPVPPIPGTTSQPPPQ